MDWVEKNQLPRILQEVRESQRGMRTNAINLYPYQIEILKNLLDAAVENPEKLIRWTLSDKNVRNS